MSFVAVLDADNDDDDGDDGHHVWSDADGGDDGARDDDDDEGPKHRQTESVLKVGRGEKKIGSV